MNMPVQSYLMTRCRIQTTFRSSIDRMRVRAKVERSRTKPKATSCRCPAVRPPLINKTTLPAAGLGMASVASLKRALPVRAGPFA